MILSSRALAEANGCGAGTSGLVRYSVTSISNRVKAEYRDGILVA